MPVNTNFQIPFNPQEGITSQILTAIQLANEQKYRQQQLSLQQQGLGIEQQRADIAQQIVGPQAEELKARSGYYGSEAAKNQLQIDNIRRIQGLFGPGQQAQGAQAPPQANAPWLPSGTPQQIAPMIAPMIPSDLSDQEKNVVEAGAQAGKAKAMQSGNLGDYLNEIRSGVDSVVSARNAKTKNPENEPISDSERQNFKNSTLPSMENLSPGQKKLAQSAVDGAKTRRELDQLQARLMAQDNQALEAKIANANRVSNENLAHTLQLDKDGRDKIIANNNKWSDAQTQIEIGNKSIQAASSGDDLATRMLPTMEVLGINMTGGIKRISPTEADAARIPVSWANRFNQWLDSRTQGATDAELLKEGKRLFNDLGDARYSAYLSEQKSVASNYKMSPKDVSVIDNNGQSVSLDKASAAGPKTPAPSKTANTLPAGAIPGTMNGKHGYVLNGEFHED